MTDFTIPPREGVEEDSLFEIPDRLSENQDTEVVRDTRRAPENLQGIGAQNVVNFSSTRAPRDAANKSAFEELPLPKTYGEALRNSIGRHGVGFVPDPDSSGHIERLSRASALNHYKQLQLFDEVGVSAGVSPEDFQDTIAAYRQVYTTLYSEPSLDELPRLNEIGVQNVARLAQTSALREIRDLEQRIAQNPADAKRYAHRLQVAREDHSVAKSFEGQADSPRMQSLFMDLVLDAERDIARVNKETSGGARANILVGLMESAFERSSLQGQLSEFPQNYPGYIRRTMDTLQRRLFTRDPETGKITSGFDKMLDVAFRDSLVQLRAGYLGVPEEETQNVTPLTILNYTHPTHARKLSGKAELHATKRFLANTDNQLLDFPEQVEAITESVGPKLVDNLIGPIESDMRRALREASTLGDTPAELINGAALNLTALGQQLKTGLWDFTGTVGNVLSFYRKIGVKPPIDARGFGMLGLLPASAEAFAAAAKPETTATRGSSNPWLASMGPVFRDTADGLRLTHEAASKIFAPDGHPLRALGVMYPEFQAAQVVDELEELGLSPAEMRDVFEERRARTTKKILDESFNYFSDEEFDKAVVRSSRSDTVSEKALNTADLAVKYMGREALHGMSFFYSNPAEATSMLALGGSAGFVGGQVVKPIRNDIRAGVANHMRLVRTKTAFRKAAKADISAVERMRSVFSSFQKIGAQGEVVWSKILDGLDYISSRNKAGAVLFEDTGMRPALNKRMLANARDQMADGVTEIIPELQHLVLDSLNFDSITRNWINSGRMRDVVLDPIRRATPFHYKVGRRRVPFLLMDTPDVPNEMTRFPGQRLHELPVNMESLTAENTSVLKRLFPEHRRALNAAREIRSATEFLSKFQRALIERQALGHEAKNNLVEWTKFRRIGLRNAADEINFLATQDPGNRPFWAELLGNLRHKVNRHRGLEQEFVRNKNPLTKTHIREHPAFDDIEPEDLMAFLSSKYDRHQIYSRLRKPFESAEKFWTRLGEMVTRHAGVTPKTDPGDFKRLVLQEFFEQPGLDESIELDGLLGAPGRKDRVTGRHEERQSLKPLHQDRNQRLKNLKRPDTLNLNDEELAAYAKARLNISEPLRKFREKFGDDFVDDLELELTSPKLRAQDQPDTILYADKEFGKLKERAKTATAARLKEFGGSNLGLVGLMGTTSGRADTPYIRDVIQDTRDVGEALRHRMVVNDLEVDALQKEYFALTPEERELFDTVGGLVRDYNAQGAFRVLRQNPQLRRAADRMLPRSRDENVAKLWDDSMEFRRSFLRDAREADMIDADTYDKLARDWVPRQYNAHAVAEALDSPLDVQKTGGALSNFKAKRHPKKWRALVFPDGTRPLEASFDTRDAAQKWVRENYGVKGDPENIEGSLKGATAGNSPYEILKPLGPEADALGRDLVKPGPGMFSRMRRVVSDMMERQYFDTFNLPGIAKTDDEFQRMVLFENMGRRAQEKWIKLSDSPALGGLRGKWIHKKVAREMAEYSDMRRYFDSVVDLTLSEAIDTKLQGMGLLGQGVRSFLGLEKWVRDGITGNYIARFFKTTLKNFVGDNFIYAPFASDLGVAFSRKGWKHLKESWDVSRALSKRNVRPSDLPEDIREGLELGIRDDTIFSVHGRKGAARANDIESVFGEHIGSVRSTFKDPRLAKLRKEHQRIRDVMASEKYEKFSDSTKKSLQSALARIQATLDDPKNVLGKWLQTGRKMADVAVGRQRGAFGDAREWTQQFYGDVSNATRLRVYLYLKREKGLTSTEAAELVNGHMQTYSKVDSSNFGRLGRFLGGVPLLGTPIVSFQLEHMRIMLNTITRRPGKLAALWATMFTHQVAGLMASGVDPYVYMSKIQQDSPLGLFGVVSRGTLPVPGMPGESLQFSAQPLAFMEEFGRGYSTIAKLAERWDNHGGNPLISNAMKFAINGAAMFIGGSPVANAAISMTSKYDPETFSFENSTSRVLKDGVRTFFRPVVHPYFPVGGSVANRLENISEGFPHAYTRREKSLFNEIFTQLTAVKVDGDLSAAFRALPKKLADPARNIAHQATRALTLGLTWKDPPEHKVLGAERTWDIEDYFGLVMAQSSDLDGNARDPLKIRQEAEADLRAGLSLIGKDPEAGHNIASEALKELADLRVVREAADKPLREMSRKQKINVIERILKINRGFHTSFEELSFLRRTYVLAKMAQTQMTPDAMFNTLLDRFKRTPTTREVRTPTDPEEIRSARLFLQRAIADFGIPEERAEVLRGLDVFMNRWEILAQRRQLRRERKPERQEAVELFEGLN